MSAPPLVRCEAVSLSYDGLRPAVDGLAFEVAPASIFALVGPNGAGKTSTLRMLATLTEPTEGRILVDGVDTVGDPEGARRRVGYLPDHFALYDAMTPVEYLDFFARLHDVPPAARRARIDALLDELDLAGKRASPIRALSRGMRQRLGLAKTLVHEPRVLLLDEPASALDPGARLKLRDALVRLKRRGLAIVISSHILPDLSEVADAVGIMEGGRMIHVGPLAGAVRGARVVYLVEVRAHADRAGRAFAAIGAPVEELGGGRFAVELEGEEAAAELVETLVLRGVRVSRVAPRESALEAMYRASAAGQVS
jgi:ABC-2 type transport system ATP-binding protein